MKRLLVLLALVLAIPAHAQSLSKALVVNSCGGQTYKPGSPINPTMDVHGQLCLGGGGSGGGGSSCAEAAAYLARAPGETEHAADLTTLICGLVADGVWPKLDALYVFAQQDIADAQLNLVSTNYTVTSGFVSSDFGAYQGFYMSNLRYADTNFDPTVVVGAKYTQNNASYGLWSYSAVSGAGCQAGQSPTNNTAMYIHFSDDMFYGRLNNQSDGVPSTVVGGGMFVADRPDASNVWLYQNGVSGGAIAAPSSAMTAGTVFFGFCASSGLGADQILSEAHIGASLGAAGNVALYNRVKTYMAAVPSSKPGPKPPPVLPEQQRGRP